MRLPWQKRIRFSGEMPPLDMWRKYPIWEFCLDEECVEGQDETTTRPSRKKYWVPRSGFDPADVMGEVHLADGRILPASFGIAGDRPLYLSIYFNPPSVDTANEWRLRFRERPFGRWDYDDDSAVDLMFAESHAGRQRPCVSLSDPSVFPLRVVTFAPKYKGTSYYALIITPDGREKEESR